MAVTSRDIGKETIRLEPEKAARLDAVLDLIGLTAQGRLRWERRPADAKPLYLDYLTPQLWLLPTLELLAPSTVEYEATGGSGRYILSVLPKTSPANAHVVLTRLNEKGEHTDTEFTIAALDGLVAVVEDSTEKA